MPVYDVDSVRDLCTSAWSLSQLSNQEVADMAGVHPTTILNFINGITKSPHYRTVVNITRVLGYGHFLRKDG